MNCERFPEYLSEISAYKTFTEVQTKTCDMTDRKCHMPKHWANYQSRCQMTQQNSEQQTKTEQKLIILHHLNKHEP